MNNEMIETEIAKELQPEVEYISLIGSTFSAVPTMLIRSRFSEISIEKMQSY